MNNELIKELRQWAMDCYRIGPDGEPDGCPGMMKFEEILCRHEHDEENENGDTITMRQSDLRYFQEHKEEFIKWRQEKEKHKTPFSLMEELSALEHEQWMQWAKSIAQTEALSPERLERWGECLVPYAELPEQVKEYDREWAKKALTIISLHDKAVEPLEALAKRKGLEMFVSIAIQGDIGVRDMLGDDYADAEAKARKFLNELPDREAK